MPYICKVASGKLPILSVYGDDYPTRDGSGVRDYIHVVDLAKGHVCALDYMRKNKGAKAVNLGTGNGYSVFELVRAYEKASGITVPFKVTERRPGDAAECYADPSLAKELLGWSAEYGVDRMCEDVARWQKMNPDGYGD
jgi:UDP-glucose 4-epimerase